MIRILVGDPVGTMELLTLERQFDLEVECEANHSNRGQPPCSHVVVARFTSGCVVSKNVCQSCVDYIEACKRADTICSDCNIPVRTDWNVRAI
jgi:hypothetical protein